jgi:hypothetical protein
MPKPGEKMRQRKVACLDCQCELWRATYFKQPRCGPCRKKRYERNWREVMIQRRAEARRYRIITHILGWPATEQGFQDMLEEMRKSPMAFRKRPETDRARRDWNFEKRVSE